MTTPTIDRIMPGADVPCHWCDADGVQTYRYGTLHNGQHYWSPSLCSTECHDEMYGGGE